MGVQRAWGAECTDEYGRVRSCGFPSGLLASAPSYWSLSLRVREAAMWMECAVAAVLSSFCSLLVQSL